MALSMCPAQLLMLSMVMSCSESPREIRIPLQESDAQIKWQIATPGLSDGKYSLVVSSRQIERKYPMWEDWGPAQQARFYIDHDDRGLLVLGAGADIMIDLTHNKITSLPMNRHDIDMKGWCFVGKVDGPPPVHFEKNNDLKLCDEKTGT
ncbi:hypothetical protein M9979_02300 [Sphingomonas sp. RP10(2022)]|uniref:Uncharacterized protein n=1 Tax=Sphingomonas liriopis TaxID=2949094 RepID=A0A9X2HUH1_9SPHN|nr:hypothetical protein [Sphingomonas liriopis]MCP3733713.1 hypothetical protein [Sphingomonas liriopis]